MSKPINKTLLGGFVLTALGMIVAAILVFGSGRLFKTTENFVMYFQGSVKGLNVGSPVMFRGVKIGAVKDIELFFDPDNKDIEIPVLVELEPGRVNLTRENFKRNRLATLKELIDRGFRARLEMQSIVTGQLLIALDFYPGTKVKWHPHARYPEIPTIPTALEELSRTLQRLPLEEMTNKLASVVATIDKRLSSPELDEGLKNLSEALKEMRQLTGHLNAVVGPITSSLEETVKDYGQLARKVNGKVDALSSGMTDILGETGALLKKVDARVAELGPLLGDSLKAAESSLKRAEKTLATVGEVAGDSRELRYLFVDTLKEISSAARSIRYMADYLEKHPEALVRGKSEPGGR